MRLPATIPRPVSYSRHLKPRGDASSACRIRDGCQTRFGAQMGSPYAGLTRLRYGLQTFFCLIKMTRSCALHSARNAFWANDMAPRYEKTQEKGIARLVRGLSS